MNNFILPGSLTKLKLANQPSNITTDLNGAQGINRDWKNPCQLRANSDIDAIDCWLNEYRHKATTDGTYQKEAERFLLWCVYQQKKPLSSVDREDLAAYIHFLDDPQPKELWCAKPGGRHNKRGSECWKPFTGPLSPSAKATTLSALDSLFNYLVQAHYLIFNPLGLIRKRHSSKKIPDGTAILQLQERILEMEEWHTMLDVLENFPEITLNERKEKARLKFIVTTLYFLGLRIEELCTHTFGAFKKIDEQWWFFVIGKGSKLGKIPVNDALLREIIHYRNFLGKAPLPINNEPTPLIHSFRTGKRITPRQINKLLKKLALETAEKYRHQPEKAKKLKKFSAHWLRHLSASMQDRAGITFKHIRENLRHENDETTRGYVHALDNERYQDMQKLTLRIEISALK